MHFKVWQNCENKKKNELNKKNIYNKKQLKQIAKKSIRTNMFRSSYNSLSYAYGHTKRIKA